MSKTEGTGGNARRARTEGRGFDREGDAPTVHWQLPANKLKNTFNK